MKQYMIEPSKQGIGQDINKPDIKEIPFLLDGIHNAIERLQNQMSVLYERITPVIAITDKVEKENGMPTPVHRSALGNNLQEIHNKIVNLTTTVSYLTEQVQL